MRRQQLLHVILEIGRRFDIDGFYIIGSAAILAAVPNPPVEALTATRDVDVIPPRDEAKLADQISYVIGEASDFDYEYGYYAQGVTSETPRYAPAGWKERAIPLAVEGYTAYCMAPDDLFLSKICAGRDKDMDFVRALAKLDLVDRTSVTARLAQVALEPELLPIVTQRIDAVFGA